MSLSLCRKRRNQDDSSLSSEETSAQTVRTNNVKRSRCEVRASQGSLSQSQLDGTLSSQRCGKILSMHLTNFMCHSNLSIDFSPRVNFLVGSNGSGKSALLAALVLGMGAKAKATNRSGSMKQLIKTGENSAKIEITISNDGPQAYEADVYGDQITIIRNINQSAATYTIKSAHGNVISRKVDDLHRILMYHNVQVDNPVFVLNQDSAREFLKELEPSKNYKLFLKATQIEMVMEKLTDCFHSNKDLINRMQFFKKKLVKNKEEIDELKNKLSVLMSVKKLKDTLTEKKLEHFWIIVTQQEQDLLKYLEEIEKVTERKTTLASALSNKDDLELHLTQKVGEFEKIIAAKNTAYSKENNTYQQQKKKLNEINQRHLEISAYVDSFKKRRSYLEAQIKELHQHINERSNNNEGDIAAMRTRNEQSLAELRNLHAGTVAMIDTTKRDLKIFVDNKMQKDEQLAEIRRKVEHSTQNMARISSNVANISASSKDKLSIYGDHVVQLLSEVGKYYKAGRFDELPRGPIGSYIEVPDARYRDVVENQIGRLLHGFIVCNTKDRLTLDALIKQRFPNYHPIIITTKFQQQVYDVSRGCVNVTRGTHLLLNLVKCSDPVVMNCLIDRVQMETVLLADNKRIAEELTSQSENVPRNLQKVIVPQQGLEYYPEPNYRMYSLKMKPARFLQVNVKERIRQLEHEKEELQQQTKTLSDELAALLPLLRDDQKRIGEKRQLLEQHEEKKNELLEKITELENFEYPEHLVDILKKELSVEEGKLDGVLQQLNDKKIELSETRSEKERFECELNAQKEVMQGIQQEIDAIQTNSDSMRMKLRNLSDTFRKSQAQLAEIDSSLEQMMAEKTRKEALLAKVTAEAEELGARVQTVRTEEEVTEEIQQLIARIKQNVKNNDDPDKLQDLIASKEHTFELDKTTYSNIKIPIDMLKKSLLTRFDFVTKLKQHMVLLLQFSFNSILKLRNFVGSIEVDHQEKTLTVSVIPRDNHLENAVSSTRALSGGERSYSTVALLLSLWSCVDHPFYFLDEYDVFTDEVNREYMTRLLLNEGKKRPHRQYTFLTPQDMTVKAENYIKIHKLAEPDRR